MQSRAKRSKLCHSHLSKRFWSDSLMTVSVCLSSQPDNDQSCRMTATSIRLTYQNRWYPMQSLTQHPKLSHTELWKHLSTISFINFDYEMFWGPHVVRVLLWYTSKAKQLRTNNTTPDEMTGVRRVVWDELLEIGGVREGVRWLVWDERCELYICNMIPTYCAHNAVSLVQTYPLHWLMVDWTVSGWLLGRCVSYCPTLRFAGYSLLFFCVAPCDR